MHNLKISCDQEAHEDFGKYGDGNLRLHDAAFDAYITGVVFTMLTKRIEIEGSLSVAKSEKKRAQKDAISLAAQQN